MITKFRMQQSMGKLIVLCAIATFGLLWVNPNTCFSQTGSIKGQLYDQTGRPANQYPITIRDLDTESQFSVRVVTDFSGAFDIAGLSPGRYIVYPVKLFDLAVTVTINGEETLPLTPFNLPFVIAVELSQELGDALNPEARATINPEAAKTLNLEAAHTLNAEAAKTLNPFAAITLNPEAARTLNPEAAKTINDEAATTLNSDAAATLNPEAAATLNPRAAATLNSEAARVLHPELAKILTREQAINISVEDARKAP